MPLLTGTVGNVGTVSFLGENIQRDWRGQLAANVTGSRATTRVKFGTEYNHVCADQLFGFNQFGTLPSSATAAAMLEVLSRRRPDGQPVRRAERAASLPDVRLATSRRSSRPTSSRSSRRTPGG